MGMDRDAITHIALNDHACNAMCCQPLLHVFLAAAAKPDSKYTLIRCCPASCICVLPHSAILVMGMECDHLRCTHPSAPSTNQQAAHQLSF
jgi:hypothetical protein